MVLEPDGVEVERRRQVQDVRTATLEQVWNDQLRPETRRRRYRRQDDTRPPDVFMRSASYVRYVPLKLIPSIRSTFFIGVSRVPVRLMALALFTRMSIPVNRTGGQ